MINVWRNVGSVMRLKDSLSKILPRLLQATKLTDRHNQVENLDYAAQVSRRLRAKARHSPKNAKIIQTSLHLVS